VAVPVLHDIPFDIAEEEFLALMGPSGSGKTTLLNLLSGIDKTDSGTIRVGGVDMTALLETERPLARQSRRLHRSVLQSSSPRKVN